MKETHPTAYIFKLIEDRFAPFTKVAGPLYAGDVQFNQSTGSLYLTEAHTWLYNGEQLYDIHTLTHEQVSGIGDPIAIVSHLLHGVATTAGSLHSHLTEGVRTSEDPVALLGFYLGDSTATVVDAIALKQHRQIGSTVSHSDAATATTVSNGAPTT